MDCDLNQWKNQQYQSDGQQAPAKIPRLLLEQPHHHQQQPSSASASALPLFVPEPNNRISSLSAFSDSTPTRFSSGMGCVFSMTQWQELELQALIFKYMLAGEPIPPELLLPIKRSFLNTPAAASACYHYPYPQYQQYQHYQPAMLQSGYWGRNAVDQEPGRCRRTDGKKWRCSREIVPGHKYCERHVHRGRNRSRKLVEGPTPTAIKGDPKAPNQTSDLPITALPGGPRFNVSVPPPPTNFIQFNQSRKAPENIGGNVGLLNIPNGDLPGEGESDGQLLRQFFDDWPRSNQELNGLGSNGGSDASLSISSSGNSSEFALKLSTGNGDEPEYQDENARGVQSQLDWGAGWNGQQGGPLAEALRSSTSNASPTSVLYELRRGTASETSSVST